MRFFHQAARRAAVLLLCLSMLTGMLISAFAATTDPATETPAHNLVCRTKTTTRSIRSG